MNTPPKSDLLLDQVDEVRRRMFAECDNDLDKWFAHVMEHQKQFADRLISRREQQPDGQSAA